MIIPLIVLVIACLVWLFHPRFNPQITKPEPKDVDQPPTLSPEEATIIGKSKFVLSQAKPNKATDSQTDKEVDKERTFDPDEKKLNDVQVPYEELDKSFSDTPEPNEPLDVDITEEFESDLSDTDLDEEAEELRQILGNDIGSADGVDYDDLHKANKTVLTNNTSPEEDEQAGAVFYQIQPTDVFEQMIAENIEKEDKVKLLMAIHLKKYYGDTETTEDVKRDLSGFIN